MNSKGITFDLAFEKEAAVHLRAKCQFFRIYAYRKPFSSALAIRITESTRTSTSAILRC